MILYGNEISEKLVIINDGRFGHDFEILNHK